jgi:hypothetical protein
MKTEGKHKEIKKLERIKSNSFWRLPQEECNMGLFLQFNVENSNKKFEKS